MAPRPMRGPKEADRYRAERRRTSIPTGTARGAFSWRNFGQGIKGMAAEAAWTADWNTLRRVRSVYHGLSRRAETRFITENYALLRRRCETEGHTLPTPHPQPGVGWQRKEIRRQLAQVQQATKKIDWIRRGKYDKRGEPEAVRDAARERRIGNWKAQLTDAIKALAQLDWLHPMDTKSLDNANRYGNRTNSDKAKISIDGAYNVLTPWFQANGLATPGLKRLMEVAATNVAKKDAIKSALADIIKNGVEFHSDLLKADRKPPADKAAYAATVQNLWALSTLTKQSVAELNRLAA